jgi:4-hydroxy-L-threonine phosphate dehydrogenase PdxA
VSDAAVALHAPGAEVGRHSLAALDAAIDAVVGGRARAVVTGPVSKEAIVAAGHAFIGQTEHLARRAGLADDDVTMLFLGPRLRVGLVTTHLAIADAPQQIDARRVERTIRHLADAVGRLRPNAPLRIDVAGLNPHAGEGGLFGHEEIDVVAPVCVRLRASAPFDGHPFTLVGPRASEASFREAASGKVDAVVAMLHDQATIASKLLDWGQAVNVTWGLPFVRTSVDHGVAYDAARDGLAEAEGMIAALRMAQALTEPT